MEASGDAIDLEKRHTKGFMVLQIDQRGRVAVLAAEEMLVDAQYLRARSA
ncbi:hypothetical protein W822_01540 [Advenella kashmirensis W13003]|uniref:Uncharacterized protein n=1 Tax=Advenella kashmirensis W13003 TaxID=1424334 RepID=V8QZB0_9BURK|nr:hypothetical protein [Advenella kashmirensis]ETF04650.1 hypothetical protein W822_01540 [Advenella kashmirensis W13003]